jgi:pimeloyl-ACP methyl ester carboxylesterase
MKNQIAHTANGSIEYTWLGDGPVILACHGTSSDCHSNDGYAPLLEAGFSVLTPSRPGYGHTPSEAGTSAKEGAEALIALLDILDIKKCALMAISGGGPTGIALAANWPQRIDSFVLIAAISRPEVRPNEPNYQSQVAFYGPMHNVTWTMLQLMSRLSPKTMARQTMAIFSNHDPQEALRRLTPDDIKNICRFYRRHSSRKGALNDLKHTVGKELLQKVKVPTLVIHSREDKSVPFSHAEWSLTHIPNSELCEGGFTGHFYWIGPDYQRISKRLVDFIKAEKKQHERV